MFSNNNNSLFNRIINPSSDQYYNLPHQMRRNIMNNQQQQFFKQSNSCSPILQFQNRILQGQGQRQCQSYIQNMKQNMNTRNIFPPSINQLRSSNSCLLPNANYNYHHSSPSSNTLRNNSQGKVIGLDRQLNNKIRLIEQKMQILEKKSMQMARMNNIAMRLLSKSITKLNNGSISSSFYSGQNINSHSIHNNIKSNNFVTVKPNDVDMLNKDITALRNELLRRFERIDKKQKLQMAGIQYVCKYFR